MFYTNLFYAPLKEQTMNKCRSYKTHTMLLLAILTSMALWPSTSYGLDYQETSSDHTIRAHDFSQGDTMQQQFGDNCSAYLNDNYDFARDLQQRKEVNYAGPQQPEFAVVIGFSITLGPDSVIGNDDNRLSFDTAGANTMNGPLSGFAAYRDCRTQNMLNRLQ